VVESTHGLLGRLYKRLLSYWNYFA
jgi:hypothetical protein